MGSLTAGGLSAAIDARGLPLEESVVVPGSAQRKSWLLQSGLPNAAPNDCDRDYAPRPPDHFNPSRIVLTRGSSTSASRRSFVDRVCSLYPKAQVIEQPNLPHNRVDLGPADPVKRHYSGKQTLVIGEHRSAVRLSEERANMCPNYWHFSPYGFCPFDCTYCYLAATPGVRFSPTVKIFVNLSEMLAKIDRVARKRCRPSAFYLGKLQDGLALDPLTGYSRMMVPFFASHPYARLVLLTKAADVRNLMDLEHRGRTILSWSLNPPEVCGQFELNTPTPGKRIEAMGQCAAAGYPVRAVIMPIIPISGWREVYGEFLQELITAVPLARLTLGGICSYDGALSLTESKLGPGNAVSETLRRSGGKSADGRRRYEMDGRIEMYRHLIKTIRSLDPQLPIALCLEERTVFEALDLLPSAGRCNCVL